MEKLYWFVSVPKKQCPNALRDVQGRLERSQLGTCSQFSLPELKIGTLDTLMALMDDLVKHDTFLGAVTVKLARQLVDLQLDEENDQSQDNRDNSNAAVDLSRINLDELLTVGQATMDPWLKKFRWNAGRWDFEKNSLHSITDDIVKTATTVDSTFRVKTQDWISLNRSIASAKSVASGSVLLRDLAGLLKKEQVIDTENLQTLLVVVPKFAVSEWNSWYETIDVDDLRPIMQESGTYAGRAVMPGSSQQIAEDSDSVLMSVVILRRFNDKIRATLREKKFMPREFTIEELSQETGKERNIGHLVEKRKAAKLELWKFSKAQFTEMFQCWVHLKAIRVWVESVVRFSLPADFEVILIRLEKRNVERIRKVLQDLFKGLVAEGVLDWGGGKEDAIDGMQAIPAFVTEELFPYVFSELSIVGRQG